MGTKMTWLDFKVKGRGHCKTTTWSDKHSERYFLTYLQNEGTYLMKLISQLPQYLWRFEGHEFKVRVTDIILWKCTFVADAYQPTVHCWRVDCAVECAFDKDKSIEICAVQDGCRQHGLQAVVAANWTEDRCNGGRTSLSRAPYKQCLVWTGMELGSLFVICQHFAISWRV